MSFYKIYLSKEYISSQKWQKLIDELVRYLRPLSSIELHICQRKRQISYFLETELQLPSIITGCYEFSLEKTSPHLLESYSVPIPYLTTLTNFTQAIEHFTIRNCTTVRSATIKITKLYKNYFCKTEIKLDNQRFWLPLVSPSSFLSIDFSKNKQFYYDKPKNQLNIRELLPQLIESSPNPLLLIRAYPYSQRPLLLTLQNYNFALHSLIVGASGSGKSKFLSLFIRNLITQKDLREKYRVVVIDPHDAIRSDIGEYGQIIDFINERINIFSETNQDNGSSAELNFDLIKSLLPHTNPMLERTLRQSCYLLSVGNCFSFKYLRNLLLDLDFRTELIHDLKTKLPLSTISFFLSDFNEIRTKYYNEAISPIISFIDEFETISCLSERPESRTLSSILENNPITIFSLNYSQLGQKAIMVISGFVMQEIFSLARRRRTNNNIILIIDEVALVENPTLIHYLSEARKYNLTLIMATQYLNQLTEDLQTAIFANIVNYYIFRTARLDAELFARNLRFKFLEKDITENQKINLFTDLNPRECIVQVSNNNVITSAVKARTADY